MKQVYYDNVVQDYEITKPESDEIDYTLDKIIKIVEVNFFIDLIIGLFDNEFIINE